MSKLAFTALSLIAMTALAHAGITKATPGPLLGAVGGPWGLVASAIGYGAYRLYKAKR
jgi:hypothetical protein